MLGIIFSKVAAYIASKFSEQLYMLQNTSYSGFQN